MRWCIATKKFPWEERCASRHPLSLLPPHLPTHTHTWEFLTLHTNHKFWFSIVRGCVLVHVGVLFYVVITKDSHQPTTCLIQWLSPCHHMRFYNHSPRWVCGQSRAERKEPSASGRKPSSPCLGMLSWLTCYPGRLVLRVCTAAASGEGRPGSSGGSDSDSGSCG